MAKPPPRKKPVAKRPPTARAPATRARTREAPVEATPVDDGQEALQARLRDAIAVGEQAAWCAAELQLQFAEACQELAALRSSLATAEADRDATRVELAAVRAELARVRETARMAEDGSERALARADEAVQAALDARRGEEHAVTLAESARGQFRELTAAVEKLREERDAAHAANANAAGQIETLRAAQHEAIVHAEHLAAELARAQLELEALRAHVADLEAPTPPIEPPPTLQ